MIRAARPTGAPVLAAPVMAALVLACLAPAAAQDPLPPAGTSLNPLAGLTLDSLSATRDLPLFTPSRSAPVVETTMEPPPAIEPETVAPEPVPPSLRLIGIVMAEAGRMALLADPGTGLVQRLAPGATVDGWTLEILDAKTVAFSRGDRQHRLTLFEPGSNPPPALPVEPHL